MKAAVEFLGQYKSLKESLRNGDNLWNEPSEAEVDEFFQENKLSEFASMVTKLQYENQANLSNRF